MIRGILQHPDPRLRQVSRPVEFFGTDYLGDILRKMKVGLLHDSPHGARTVGIAAIQVGEPYRIIIVVQGGQQIVMINPRLIRVEGEQLSREGCMSVDGGATPMLRKRPLFVQVEYQDEDGQHMRRKAKGLNAAVIAHECDHLDGILYIDDVLPEKAA